MAIAQRIEWAKAYKIDHLRPEIDLEYAEFAMSGASQNTDTQLMRQPLITRFINDRVMTQLKYFPGNCFWISAAVLSRLNQKLDFEKELLKLPSGLNSDTQYQSRAHAWERILAIFSEKNGFAARPLVTLEG